MSDAVGSSKIKKLKIDALIPSRRDSEGLYRKSKVILGTKPLIEYTLEAAMNASSLRHIYLSTDEEDILKEYSGHKRIKTIIRPEAFAEKKVSIKDVVLHAIKEMKQDAPDILVVLLPTSPLRKQKHIDSAIRFAGSLSSFDSVVSINKIKVLPYGGIALNKNKKVQPLIEDSVNYYRRQDQPPAYTLNGSIFIINCARIDKLNDFLISDESYGFEMEEPESVDIDTPYDIAVAEAALSFRNEQIDSNFKGRFNLQRLYIYDDPQLGIHKGVFDSVVYERHFKRYKFFLQHINASDCVLDIACGSGYGTEILASKARSVHGVDTDPKTIEYARRHHGRANVTFDASSAENFTPTGRYDKIISVETIEHLADPDKFIECAKEWLNPGGELWLTCPLVQDEESSTESPFHISELTKERLNRIMKRCFKDVEIFELNDGQFFALDTLKNRVVYIVAKGTNK
ncbi:MAG: methyltransferase domain-containing protein [Mobilitalea sp.]